ncbi:MAG: DnaJ domain-containing protein [Flavobacteriales bacterium]|nr:DnaJ domain-containing protein [Flavobacteriales bacterium]
MESAYKTLEASPSESFDEIREKFIRKIIKIHPDKDELKSEEAKALTEAWAYIKEHHNNNNNKTEPVATVVSHRGQDSEMKQFLKQIYQEGKVAKLEDKEEKGWFTTLYDYLWGDDSDEEETQEETQEIDESKLYNEVDEEPSNNEKIEKTLRE